MLRPRRTSAALLQSLPTARCSVCQASSLLRPSALPQTTSRPSYLTYARPSVACEQLHPSLTARGLPTPHHHCTRLSLCSCDTMLAVLRSSAPTTAPSESLSAMTSISSLTSATTRTPIHSTGSSPLLSTRLQPIVHALSISIIRMLCPPRSHAKVSVICVFQALFHCTLLGGGHV